MKNQYTKDELNQLLNSIDASHETKCFLEKNLKPEIQKTTSAYLNILAVITSTYIFMNTETVQGLGQQGKSALIFFAAFMLGNRINAIRQIKSQNAILDLVMTNKKSEPVN